MGFQLIQICGEKIIGIFSENNHRKTYFISVNVHYYDGHKKVTRVLCVKPIPKESHDGPFLLKLLKDVLVDFGIPAEELETRKFLALVTDSAPNNMAKDGMKVAVREFFHLKCADHLINTVIRINTANDSNSWLTLLALY